MERQYLWNLYTSIPVITRIHTTACILMSLAVQVDLVSMYQIYFNPRLVVFHFQWWRLLTCFLYYGPLDFHFLFNILFTYGYCRGLEETSFNSNAKTADFIIMFVFGMLSTLFIGYAANLIMLGPAFTLMLVYVWCRRNPSAMMNFFGLFTVNAPVLPLVLLGFSLLLGDSGRLEIVGIVVGHMYYFLEDVFPRQRGGFRVLEPPTFLKNWLHPREEEDEQIRQVPIEEDGLPPVVPLEQLDPPLILTPDYNNNNNAYQNDYQANGDHHNTTQANTEVLEAGEVD